MSVKAMVAVKDGASAVLGKIGSTLKSLAKGVTIAVGIAGAGATALMGKSLGEGAKLQHIKLQAYPLMSIWKMSPHLVPLF